MPGAGSLNLLCRVMDPAMPLVAWTDMNPPTGNGGGFSFARGASGPHPIRWSACGAQVASAPAGGRVLRAGA